MLYPRGESTGDIKIVRQGHTLALKHKRHERMQFLLDQSLGPPLHEPNMPRAQQIHCLSVRGDDKVPLDAVKAKGMHQPLSVRRFRRYWGSHIARFGENVMQHVEKRVDGTQHCCLLPPFATFFGVSILHDDNFPSFNRFEKIYLQNAERAARRKKPFEIDVQNIAGFQTAVAEYSTSFTAFCFGTNLSAHNFPWCCSGADPGDESKFFRSTNNLRCVCAHM